MLKLPKLRIATLAALALSVLHLNTAQAAEPAWDQCDLEALVVLITVCEYITEGEWDAGVIVYTCDEDGHLDEFAGACFSEN